jgi:hypothetical protein
MDTLVYIFISLDLLRIMVKPILVEMLKVKAFHIIFQIILLHQLKEPTINI